MKKQLFIPLLLASSSLAATPITDAPEWAADVVWYQIFVERFHNGDRSNDPTAEDIVASYPGFAPEGWQVTPWTQQWYQPDSYFGQDFEQTDFYGNKLDNFDRQVAWRRYGGDLQGVLDKLDYLEELGVTAIYFNPLNDAPSLHKYDPKYWHHIDHNFGPTPQADLQAMAKENTHNPDEWVMTGADQLFVDVINELHQRGIRVILDYSWNHTGVSFWAWQDVLTHQENSPYKDWYWITAFDDPQTEVNEFDYHGWFGVHSLPEIRETEYVDHSDGITLAEGNISSPAARAHIFAVAQRWLDPNGDGDPSDGVDGFRLDVAAELPKGFWREFREQVRAINPEAYLIGELWWEQFPDDLLDPAPMLEGDIFDASMNYRWYRSARQFFGSSPIQLSPSEFVSALEDQQKGIRRENNYAMMNMSASHDTPRVLTSLYNHGKYKLDTKPQANHEYRINRPDEKTFNTLRMLLAHQFTYIGAPQIWAGDEMGMWGSDDPNTRKPLIWPEFNFDDETLHPVEDVERPVDRVVFDHSLNDYYRSLIAIRNDYSALRTGDIEFVHNDDDRGLLIYERSNPSERIVVAVNIGQEAIYLNDLISQTSTLLLSSDGSKEHSNLASRSVHIYRMEH